MTLKELIEQAQKIQDTTQADVMEFELVGPDGLQIDRVEFSEWLGEMELCADD